MSAMQEVTRKQAIEIAKQAAVAARASQGAIVVGFDDSGAFLVASYGHTREKCNALAETADQIAVFLRSGAGDLAGQLEALLGTDDDTVMRRMLEYVSRMSDTSTPKNGAE